MIPRKKTLLRSYKSLTNKLRSTDEINQTTSKTVDEITWEISEI